MNVDERLLRYFVVLADELHFGRAAARLYVSQPALSKQIKVLEDGLRLKLFTRTRRQVTLTPAGASLLPRAETVLTEYAAFREGVDLLRAGQGARLVVGFIAQAANELTPRALRLFGERQAHVQVDMRQSPLDDSSAGLRSEAVEIALLRLPIESDGLTVVPILTEPRVVLLPADHRLAGMAQVSLADLHGEPRIVTATLDQRFRAFALEPAPGDSTATPIGAVVSTVDEFSEAVLAGRAIALAPESARRFYARPGLTFVDVTDATPSVVAVAWRTATPLSPAAEAFVTTLQELAHDAARTPPSHGAVSADQPPSAALP